MKKAFRKSLKRQASLGYFTRTKPESDQSKSPTTIPILWPALASKFQFNYPKDWYKIEAHWLDQIESFQEQPIDCPGRDAKMNNAITRISQCNESYQLCNSLPRSFIVPKDLKDVTLIDSMSTVIKDHRVPIISYCCPIEYCRNFIIRCASSDQQAKVIETIGEVVKPLKVLNLSAIAPSLETVESAHKKLRDVCRPGDHEQGSNFFSKCGKWLNIVSLALKIVNETARIILNEASVMLIEEDDRGWNCVVSALVQLILEPHRRTVAGFESLISKEWIYLSGGQHDHFKPDLLFTLFLDCTYQVYLQNVSQFEFTSEYLRYLFEAQYVRLPSNTVQEPGTDVSNKKSINIINNNNVTYHSQRTNGVMRKSKTASYTTDEDDDIVGSEPASYKPSSMSLTDLNSRYSSMIPQKVDRVNINNNNNNNSPTSSNVIDPVQQLEDGYDMFMFSPFYEPNSDSPTLEVYDHIANMKLWSSLYLRWQPAINYGCAEETLYFQSDNLQVKLNKSG